MSTFDKVCAGTAFILGIILLVLGVLGIFLGCSAHFRLPPIVGVLPAFVGWGIVKSVKVAWRTSVYHQKDYDQGADGNTNDQAVGCDPKDTWKARLTHHKEIQMTHKQPSFAFATACVALALCATAPTVKAGPTGKGPVKVFVLAGQSNMEGQGVVDLDDEENFNSGKGNLEHFMQDPAKAHLYKHLKGDDGNWAVREDVWVWYKTERTGVKRGGLTIGYTPYPGEHHFGPELQFGHVIGDHLDNQVLLIKTAWGGKSLYQDFRPPSSGGQVGPYYIRMLEEIREALADMKKHFPDYGGRGYEIAGFVWFQGWNDMINNAAVLEYEENLANLIKDVRKELGVPNLPVVIGETGNCDNIPFRKAQAAVAQRAEFKRTVAFVETTEFRRPASESPNVGHGHHWYGNAESYFLIGNALGEAMKKLLEAACTDEKAEPPKPQSRTVRNIEGWIVRVDERLLVPPHDELGLRALKLLEAKLADIKYVMPKEPLAKLQAVSIVLDLTHGRLRAMQYHPDADWLKANGYSTDLVKCVHIPQAADLPTPRNINEQPWVILHELAHAYHDQVLGFDEPRIREAYERFKRSGHGDSVLLYNGKRVRHYALTDHKEFFAEMTEAYFGMDDFFPFNQAELMTAEPEILELLRTIWEPVQPAGAAEKAQLDKLVGQPVDIAPWAYAWRADRTIQEKPEAYFIPRRLERMDKVYRTALDQLGSDGLKSKYYDMPDLITPLPPKPKGQLLAGLLWPVRLANYRVELIWPAAREVPSPEAVEVRVYPTAFSWFGWCNDEILGHPEISADRRTWTYNHSVTTEIPAVVGRTHRRGSATEMVAVFCEEAKTPNGGKSPVPTVRLISPTAGTWKRMDVEIEWGFQSGSEEADFDGRLESDLSVIGPVSPLADDKGTTATGPQAWQSRAAGDGRHGVVLPLLYVPGDRPALDTPAVTASLLIDTTSPGPSRPGPGPTLDSRVTLWTKSGGVTFRPIDLEKGPILIPEHGLFITRAGSGKTARQFTAELAASNLKSIRQLTREHREAASWDELMREVRWWRCEEKPAVPPLPEVEEPAMQVQLSDVRWTDAWRAASHQLRGPHMWGGLAFEVGRVARQMDMVGLHDEADKVYQHFLKGAGAKPDGDYADGSGALEWATGMKHDMGYDHDGTHASTGRLLFGMAERYFLTGDKEWFRWHRDRLQAAADWIIRQRNTYMRDVSNREDLLVAGLMPPVMLGDYALPASDWRWYYCDNAFSLQGLQRFADALAEFDAEAGQNYRAEADAFRRDIRRAVDREAALSPVRLGRDGAYRSFIPIAAHTKGLMLALEFPSVGRPQGDVILGALPLAEPFAALEANDARMVGTLDVMEEVGTSVVAVRELEAARRKKGLSTADAWFWNCYGASLAKASHNANIYLLQDDVPNFLRFWMNAYAGMVGADGKMWEWGHLGDYADCSNPDNGTAGWFLENFRNLLVMEEGQSLWVARATPRAWLEQGKKISVKNAPTYFGTLAYEIVSDAENGKIVATLEIPGRNPPKSVRLRFRHPKSVPIRSVTVNGNSWQMFSRDKEVIELIGFTGQAVVSANY